MGWNRMTDPEFTAYQRYNALDCAMTIAIFEEIRTHRDNHTGGTYELSKSLVGPAMEMMLRGVRRDIPKLQAKLAECEAIKETLKSHLLRLAQAAGRKTFNPNSPLQISEILHDRLAVKPMLKRNSKGEHKPSTDRLHLEKLMEAEGGAVACFIKILLSYRDYKKAVEALSMRPSPDGRWRATCKIAGTTTGRWSMSEDSFGDGGNLQNLHEDTKEVVIADDGFDLVAGDLSQADSWNVGIQVWAATGDEVFLDAVRSGDIHTFTAKLAWPELPWTGVLSEDRLIAERLFYRHHSYRFMCKKINHGSAYGMRYRTLARNVRIPEALAKEVEDRYRAAFPALFRWQEMVWEELKLQGYLTTLLNRKRWFLGKSDDPKVFREAIAFLGQSPTSDVINHTLRRLHPHPLIQLLLQEHDSILMQVRSNQVRSLLPYIHQAFHIPIEAKDRVFYIPVDLKVGKNWGAWSERNPNGLRKRSLH